MLFWPVVAVAVNYILFEKESTGGLLKSRVLSLPGLRFLQITSFTSDGTRKEQIIQRSSIMMHQDSRVALPSMTFRCYFVESMTFALDRLEEKARSLCIM